MKRRVVLVLLGVVVLSVAWLWECSGPKPVVQGTMVREPAQEGLPYEVDVQVRNTWRGEGELQVKAELRDKTSSRRYQGQQNASIEPMETINVVVEVNAEPGDYEPMVEVQYPPR